MPIRILVALAATLAIAAPATASSRPHLPPRPSTASLLAAAPIAPNGTLIRDGERLRTLELDELAPLRLRFTIPF
ncbi:hypothetical protein MMSR116_29055 [Methylobacterium mesophilicum SR1.6/6]|uniref:Uncharacterized protein n=1 Tax=Methylobacterium mesophilicum SR1.6/6 TaxID=908290 RepID=A0A6B9FY55_9HYPH|nr:hypothetical protein [Methylobacterium mesophilicum]QGY05488.1 hypothetical protein MMSR116_29055 [Methylobacterium mesophilicum SR1.6/6]